MASNGSVLALDVGGRRIGIASASTVARIAHPLCTLENTEAFVARVQTLIQEQQAIAVVVGLPRGLEGQATQQTKTVETFADSLKQQLDVPVYLQDEAVTSVQAESELNHRGKQFTKEDIDALAATYILEDFLHDHPEVNS